MGISGYDGERRSRGDERERKIWIWCGIAAGQRLSNRTESLTEQCFRNPKRFSPSALKRRPRGGCASNASPVCRSIDSLTASRGHANRCSPVTPAGKNIAAQVVDRCQRAKIVQIPAQLNCSMRESGQASHPDRGRWIRRGASLGGTLDLGECPNERSPLRVRLSEDGPGADPCGTDRRHCARRGRTAAGCTGTSRAACCAIGAERAGG